MNRLDLTLRSTIHIQYANALAFDFSFWFFFLYCCRTQGYIQTFFSLRSKVFCMTSIRGQAPDTPKTQTMPDVCRSVNGHHSGIGSASLVYLRNLSPRPKIKAFRGFMIFMLRLVVQSRGLAVDCKDMTIKSMFSLVWTWLPKMGLKRAYFAFFPSAWLFLKCFAFWNPLPTKIKNRPYWIWSVFVLYSMHGY